MDKHLLLSWYFIVLHEMKPCYLQRLLPFLSSGGSKNFKRDIFLFNYVCAVPAACSTKRLLVKFCWIPHLGQDGSPAPVLGSIVKIPATKVTVMDDNMELGGSSRSSVVFSAFSFILVLFLAGS